MALLASSRPSCQRLQPRACEPATLYTPLQAHPSRACTLSLIAAIAARRRRRRRESARAGEPPSHEGCEVSSSSEASTSSTAGHAGGGASDDAGGETSPALRMGVTTVFLLCSAGLALSVEDLGSHPTPDPNPNPNQASLSWWRTWGSSCRCRRKAKVVRLWRFEPAPFEPCWPWCAHISGSGCSTLFAQEQPWVPNGYHRWACVPTLGVPKQEWCCQSHQCSRAFLRAGGGCDRLLDSLVPAARPVLLPPPPGPPPATLRRTRHVRAGAVHHGALDLEDHRQGRRAKPMTRGPMCTNTRKEWLVYIQNNPSQRSGALGFSFHVSKTTIIYSIARRRSESEGC